MSQAPASNPALANAIAQMAVEFAGQERKEIVAQLKEARRALTSSVQHPAIPGLSMAIKLIEERG